MYFDREHRGFKTIDLEHIICISIGGHFDFKTSES